MISETLSAEYSTESLFAGKLTCHQYLKGYRFSQDPVLLSHFFCPAPKENILDLGTGCGIIALILAYRHPGISVKCLEVQSRLAKLALENVELNNFSERVQVVRGDLKNIAKIFPAASFDRVVCNPPFWPVGAARASRDPETAIARHEINASLEDVVDSVAWGLPEGGRADFVFPAQRSEELQEVLQGKGLSTVCLQQVYSYPDGPCRLVLLEAIKGLEAEVEILSPFMVQSGPEGMYTPEMATFYDP